MECEIKYNEKDIFSPHGICSICLTPESSIVYQDMIPPVLWKGTVNQEKVKIIQKNTYARTYDDVEFEEFPEKYRHLKILIVDLIDDAIKSYD